MNEVIETGKAQMGKTDVILGDTHLDTWIKTYILMNMITPKLEYAGEEEGGVEAKLVRNLETVQMTAAKRIPACSKTSKTA